MKYVSIDIETTGLDHDCCKVLELAMILEDTAHPEVPVEDLPYYHAIFHYNKLYHGEPYALSINSALLMKIAKGEGKDPVEAWEGAEIFLGQHFGDKKAVAAGKNVGSFDLQFFPEDVKKLFDHRSLDPGSVFVDWTKDKLPSLKALIEMEDEHSAMADARDVIRVLRRAYT